MTIQAQPASAPRRPVPALVLEVHPDADHTGTLTLDYGDGLPCDVALPKSFTTLLLALALARVQDQRAGRCAMVGCRTREKLARIYGALPGALFGHIEGQHLSGYKSRLLKLVRRRVAEHAAEVRAPLDVPGIFALTSHGQGYCLDGEVVLRGVDVEELLEVLRLARA